MTVVQTESAQGWLIDTDLNNSNSKTGPKTVSQCYDYCGLYSWVDGWINSWQTKRDR